MEDILATLPSWMAGKYLGLFVWQWTAIFGILFLAAVVDKVVTTVLKAIVNNRFPIIKIAQNDFLKHLANSLGKLFGVVFSYYAVHLVNLPPKAETIVIRIIAIVAALVTVWFLHRLVNLMTYYFSEKVKETEAKFDDILVPLMSKTALIFVYAVGFILVANAFNVNVSGLVAGLGIGGLAFAFAAKDTLANIFGSLMIVLDRPFDIGDIITAGDVEGTVVQVGFRSTRIRTFYDSVITVSNGELVNRAIDNKGKRRYRRLNTTLGLEYDTPPHKIEAFCEGIRQLILSHKWTRKDTFHCYFNGLGESSLDIQLVVFWETDDYARECAEKHRLLVDIMRLAQELDVSFAFPTRTLHLFNETKMERKDLPQDKYLDEAITKAQDLVKKPLTLQNPRSNKEDENQFGKNEIGL
jgi:MscS family membrane protein